MIPGAMLACAAALAATPVSFAAEPVLAPVIRNGPEGCHAVALTFDLCPVVKGAGWDRGLVELLRARQVPATFFASGRWIAQHDAEVRELLAVPFFELGTHGQRHRHLPALDATAQQAELGDAAELLSTHYGRRPTLFRAPYGEFDDRSRAVVATLGGRLVQWSVVSGDPDPRVTAAGMLRTLRANVRDGSIVIFHANGKGAHTREVVETLVNEILPARDLAPQTVSMLLEGCDAGRP
jgi:peptidoglycan/xylan/chitin deacetylase (PgdA/CDA1 family)